MRKSIKILSLMMSQSIKHRVCTSKLTNTKNIATFKNGTNCRKCSLNAFSDACCVRTVLNNEREILVIILQLDCVVKMGYQICSLQDHSRQTSVLH